MSRSSGGSALAGVRDLHTHASELPEESVERLLAHDHENVRRVGVAIAVVRAGTDDSDLEALLDRILAGETYQLCRRPS